MSLDVLKNFFSFALHRLLFPFEYILFDSQSGYNNMLSLSGYYIILFVIFQAIKGKMGRFIMLMIVTILTAFLFTMNMPLHGCSLGACEDNYFFYSFIITNFFICLVLSLLN